MALRVGGARPPIEEEMPIPAEESVAPEAAMPPMEEDMMADDLPEEMPMEGGGEVHPLIAGYKGPESGPFHCGNCVFYGRHGEGTCAIVAGPIDEGGYCNIFTSKSNMDEGMIPEGEEDIPEPLEEGAAPTPEPMPEGEPYPTEEGL